MSKNESRYANSMKNRHSSFHFCLYYKVVRYNLSEIHAASEIQRPIHAASEIHTTKLHARHQFLPSRDAAEHIHSQVYGHFPAVDLRRKKQLNS